MQNWNADFPVSSVSCVLIIFDLLSACIQLNTFALLEHTMQVFLEALGNALCTGQQLDKLIFQ